MDEANDFITYFEDPFLKYQIQLSKLEKIKTPEEVLEWKLINQPQGIVQHAFINHHQSHGATAYYTRPWETSEDTVILTIDGLGENQSSCIYNHRLELIDEQIDPASIGRFYSLVTIILGFKRLE